MGTVNSAKEWWGPSSNGLVVMYIMFTLFVAAFVVFLVLWIMDEKAINIPNYSSWYGQDQGAVKFFGLNIAQRSFLTYNVSFEVVGVEDIDVSGDFTAVVPGPPPVKIKWIKSNDVNFATIIIDIDSAAQRTIHLHRLTLQSLTQVFNKIQNIKSIPRLFNAFY